MRVRMPSPLGGSHQCCTSPSSNWRPAARSSCARVSSGLATQVTITSCSWRSEEHTSELQSLMRISYAVFCLKKKTNKNHERLAINKHHTRKKETKDRKEDD